MSCSRKRRLVLTTLVLTDEAGKMGGLGEWVKSISGKVTHILAVIDVDKMSDREVMAAMSRHGIEVMMSEDLSTPLKTELKDK
jgi:hypothetical protein